MRNLFIILIISHVLIACSSDSKKSTEQLLQQADTDKLSAMKDSLQEEKAAINAQLKKISAKLESLNPNENLRLVEVEEASKENFKTFFNVQGDVTTDQNILLNAEFSGMIKNIYVEEGDVVNQGDIIAKIDDAGLTERIDELKNRLRLAKTTYERRKRLWEKNIGSEIEYLQAETEYNSLKQSISQVRKELEKTVLRAPFNGEIDDLLAEVGEMATPGAKPIVRLTSLEQLYIEASVPENYMGNIRKGTPVKVSSKVSDISFETTIARVANTIQESNRSFRIRIDIPKDVDHQLKPNMVLKLTINNYNKDKAFVIPESILQENTSGEPYIFKVKEDANEQLKADLTLVELGKSHNGEIEIIKGIKTGDKIVIEGAKGLRKDQEVKVKNN
jgi:RND family efflux transporter MFP subunit